MFCAKKETLNGDRVSETNGNALISLLPERDKEMAKRELLHQEASAPDQFSGYLGTRAQGTMAFDHKFIYRTRGQNAL
ncbi:MAG: hypothetical protein IPL28_11675 [Chloroflexi bacterium]|nr:hypothetical protein [Chloroflexota bacterium]